MAAGGGFVSHRCTHDTIVAIMCTSGTTGRPKGEITKGMVFWNAVNGVEFYGSSAEM